MKTVKINDFDWDGFNRGGGVRIVSNSSQNLISVLQALSEKRIYMGYVGNVSN